MKRIPPLNVREFDDERYYDFDEARALGKKRGSIPPAKAFEAPQEEIVSIIEMAGLTPDSDDNTQLYQAIELMFKKKAAGIPILTPFRYNRYLRGHDKFGFGMAGELVTSAYPEVIKHIENDLATGSEETLEEKLYSPFGTLVNENHIISGFSTTNFATTDFTCTIPQSGENKGTFFFEGSFETGTNVASGQYILNSYKTNFILPVLYLQTNLRVMLSSNGTAFDLANNLVIPSSPNLIASTKYYYRFFCLGGYTIDATETKYYDYIFALSTDNATWNYYTILSQKTGILKGSQTTDDYIKFGVSDANATPFLGRKDLNDFKAVFLEKSYGQLAKEGTSYDDICSLILTEDNKVKTLIKTTPYILAEDGDKILDIQYKAYADYLYTKENRGDFFIYDGENKQVYLHRQNNRNIVIDYKNGNHKYKLYSNGDYEEENFIPRNNSLANPIVPFKFVLADTEYFVTLTEDYTALTANAATVNNVEKTTSSMRIFKDGVAVGLYWKVQGKVDLTKINIPLDIVYYRIGEAIQDPQLLLSEKVAADVQTAVDVLDKQTRYLPLPSSGDLVLEANRPYTAILNDKTKFILPLVDKRIVNQILIDLQLDGVFSVDWGTTEFANGEAPDISLSDTFSVYYEFSNVKNAWVVGIIAKEGV